MTYLSAYSLPFKFVTVITQELCSVYIIVLSEFDKRVLKAKIDFLINASKFEILFITNILLALLRQLYHFCEQSENKDNKISYRNFYTFKYAHFCYICYAVWLLYCIALLINSHV